MTRTKLHHPLRRRGVRGGGFTMISSALSLCLSLGWIAISSRSANHQADANMLPNPIWTCDLVPRSEGTRECCHVLAGTPEDYVHHEDTRGYTVEKYNDYWMYVRRDGSTGQLRRIDYICGLDDPPADLTPHARPSWNVIKSTCHTTCEVSSRNHFLPISIADEESDDDENEDAHPEDLHPIMQLIRAKRHAQQQQQQKETTDENGKWEKRKLQTETYEMPNLVVLIRFANHVNRTLPTPEDYDYFFNSEQAPHPKLCPTGSVRDYFMFASDGQVKLTSVVTPWITVSHTEQYYSDGSYGYNKVRQAVQEALGILNQTIDFVDFDSNGDKLMDAVTFLHSGYMTEFGGVDCQTGATEKERIWSHKTSLTNAFVGDGGVRVKDYHISAGLWAVCGAEPVRLGVVVHETMHYFGLPDLYGGGFDGSGIGSWDAMGHSWGFDNSQYHINLLSPWSRIKLGFADPIEIQQGQGMHTIPASYTSGQGTIYKISQEFPTDEYLLIENRQRPPPDFPYRFEDKIPNPGGLLIYHIDDKAPNNVDVSYPGSRWKFPGDHYQVALLAADGEYHLEKGRGIGDKGDYFHASGQNEINTHGVFPSGKSFPNTNYYGVIAGYGETSHSIHDISDSGPIMTFYLDETTILPPTGTPTLSPQAFPTRPPSTDGGSLFTTMMGGNGKAGNMFDLQAKERDIYIHGFDLHIEEQDTLFECHIWTRPDTYMGYTQNASAWTNVGVVQVEGMGKNQLSLATGFEPILMKRNERQGFYIALTANKMEYTSTQLGEEEGDIFSENDHLIFYIGTGNKFDFEKAYNGRIWNGNVLYSFEKGVEEDVDVDVDVDNTLPPIIDTKRPTKAPTVQPTKFPTTEVPTDIVRYKSPHERGVSTTLVIPRAGTTSINLFQIDSVDRIHRFFQRLDVYPPPGWDNVDPELMSVQVYSKESAYELTGNNFNASSWSTLVCDGSMAFDTDEEGALVWKLGESFCNGQLTGPGITRSYMIRLSLLLGTMIPEPDFDVWKANIHYLSKRVKSSEVCGEDGDICYQGSESDECCAFHKCIAARLGSRTICRLVE